MSNSTDETREVPQYRKPPYGEVLEIRDNQGRQLLTLAERRRAYALRLAVDLNPTGPNVALVAADLFEAYLRDGHSDLLTIS